MGEWVSAETTLPACPATLLRGADARFPSCPKAIRLGANPRDLEVFVVRHVCISAGPPGQEADVEVLSHVTIGVRNGFCDIDTRDPNQFGVDAGFFLRLPHRRRRRFLSGLENAGHDGPLTVVGAAR